MRQYEDDRIDLKEAPAGMRKYWCTIVRENYKMLLGRPGEGVQGGDRRKEVIARLGKVLGQGGGGGGGGGGRVEKKLSLPISIVSPGKPALTKDLASEPLLVTKSSIRRRFWGDPRRIHHNLHGIHPNLGGIHYDLGGMHHNHHPLHHDAQGKQPQLQARHGTMASAIVAELKRDHFAGRGHQHHNKLEPEVRQVLGESFNLEGRGGRRIWQAGADSEENYISQEVAP